MTGYKQLTPVERYQIQALSGLDYTWACCREMTAFTDTHGTASLSYSDLGRMTSFGSVKNLSQFH